MTVSAVNFDEMINRASHWTKVHQTSIRVLSHPAVFPCNKIELPHPVRLSNCQLKICAQHHMKPHGTYQYSLPSLCNTQGRNLTNFFFTHCLIPKPVPNLPPHLHHISLPVLNS